MKKYDGIISFDLITSSLWPLDVSRFFPISDLHAIRSTKPLLDTLSSKVSHPLDLSIPPVFSTPRYTSVWTLDIGHPSLARARWLVDAPRGEKKWSIIDLFPPLMIPYGALDTRWDSLISEKKYGDIYRRSLPWWLHARRISRMTSQYLRKKRRPILLTLLLTVGLTVPILFYTKSLIEHAYGDLLALHDMTSRAEVERAIHDSRGNFERANLLFFPFRIFPGESTKLARIAIDGGLALTRGFDRVISALPESSSWAMIVEKDTSLDSRFRPIAKDISPLTFLGITEPTSWMQSHRSALEYFSESLRIAWWYYDEAKNIDYPKAIDIAHIGRWLIKAWTLLDTYLSHEKDILALLWADKPERYIVFNQNRDEIRTNGGFPGTILTFTMFHGNIEDYRTDDVYYYDWNLYPFKEPPPPWLALLSENYWLRDVNYYPDFGDTLEKANNFIERSGDQTVTVGIALHQWLIEDVLEDIWPVSLSGVTESFRSDNFSPLMSTLVESRYGEETSAKDILRRFVDAFITKIEEKRAYEEVLGRIEESIIDGEMLFASREEGIEKFFSTWRKPLPWKAQVWDASLSNVSWEALSRSLASQSRLMSSNWAYPTLTSLSGNKSDRFIERTYLAETTDLGGCKYLSKLTFTHKHTYNTDAEKQIRSYLSMIGVRDAQNIEKMLTIQWKGKNKAYMRIFVPPSATLTGSTAGIESNLTEDTEEISFSLDTPIGWTASKTLRYIVDIPNCKTSKTSVVWYRQPWLQNTKMMSR